MKSAGHGTDSRARKKSKRRDTDMGLWRGASLLRAQEWEWYCHMGLEIQTFFPSGAWATTPMHSPQHQGAKAADKKWLQGDWERICWRSHGEWENGNVFPHVLENGIGWDAAGSSAKALQCESSRCWPRLYDWGSGGTTDLSADIQVEWGKCWGQDEKTYFPEDIPGKMETEDWCLPLASVNSPQMR